MDTKIEFWFRAARTCRVELKIIILVSLADIFATEIESSGGNGVAQNNKQIMQESIASNDRTNEQCSNV